MTNVMCKVKRGKPLKKIDEMNVGNKKSGNTIAAPLTNN